MRNEELSKLRPDQLDSLLADVQDGMIVTDFKGKVIYMNSAAQNLYGFDRLALSEEEGHSLRDYVERSFELRTLDGKEVAPSEQPLTRLLTGQRFRDVELRVRHKESQEERVFAFSGSMLDGGTAARVLTLRDVTARDRADRRYRISFETNPAPTLIARLSDCVLVDVNEGFTELTLVSKEDALGQSLPDLGLLKVGDDLRLVVDRLRSGEVVAQQQSTILRGTEERDVLVAARPIEIDGSNCGIFTFIDISELLEVKDRLEYASAELSLLQGEFDALNYSVSHDLRTPLRGIDGFSEALLQDYGDRLDERGRDYLERVRSAAGRMGTLIDSLLKLSRLAQMDLNREVVDLTRLAREVARSLRRKDPGREVDLRVPPGIVVPGDPELLKVLLTELLTNAWKFTSEKSRSIIELGAESQGGELVFYVRDNGAGFDPVYSAKMFEPFQRLHPGSRFAGVGIGLAAAQRIVSRHGGRIWAEGEPDLGATIYFALPRASMDRAPAEDYQESASPTTGNVRTRS